MTYEDLVNIFKAASDSYTGTPALNFHYDRVWYNNGAANNKYPSMLFECAPDFDLVGQQSNGRTGQQIIKGKLFFYDLFKEAEKGAQPTVDQATYKKQSDLNELALKVIGKINGLVAAAPSQRINWGSGFMAKDVHNHALVQIFVPFTATLTSECTPLNP
jgi:hypothetical protein